MLSTSGLTTRQRAYQRDNQVIAGLVQCKALNTSQVTALYFDDIAFGYKKAQARLLRLFQRKVVNRCRVSPVEPFAYYISGQKRHGRLEHLVDLNWLYVWLVKNLRNWEVLHSYKNEVNFRILQTDAFCAIKNTVTGRLKCYFLEMDRSEGNSFDKVEKYNRLFETEGYLGHWWVEQTDRFPSILVATTTPRRLASIKEKIEKENTHELDFKVVLLDDIKGGFQYDNNRVLCKTEENAYK